LLEKASSRGVRVISITDHDSTAGIDEALKGTVPDGLQLIPGIEVSAEGDSACHVLGYYIDLNSPILQKKLKEFRELRVERLRRMIEKLRALSVDISFERVLEMAGNATLGRPHLADALVEKKFVQNRSEAFQKFLGRDAPAYVRGETPTAPEVFALIRSAGGVPVLAHPSYYSDEAFIRKLADEGLMGIEVYYPDTSRSLRQRFLDIAESLNLVATGGSDFHGPRTGRTELANVEVPESVLEALASAREKV
jgi:predicted metal-dependent phosphoesterase TrpH